MNFLFKHILIFVKDEISKKIYQLFTQRQIKPTLISQNHGDINILERLRLLNEFGVCVYEITNEKKDEILKLMERYKNIKFLFLNNGRLSMNDIYEIIINGAVDVLSINSEPALIVAKVIASFRAEFKKEKNKTITSSDGKVILDVENLRLTIEGVDYKITKKQAAILFILMTNEGMVVERRNIASVVYSDRIERVTPQLIDKHIHLLKSSIPPLSQRIKTVYGVGYIYES